MDTATEQTENLTWEQLVEIIENAQQASGWRPTPLRVTEKRYGLEPLKA